MWSTMRWRCHDVAVTLVIAHRGASRAEAENTIAAFERAAQMGADGVELDVRRTADDRLVVHHDAHLPDGRAIRSVAAADLPTSVPTLTHALDACAGMFVNVEIKNDRSEPDHDRSDWVADRVAVELERRGGGPRWLLSSFRLRTVDRCRQAMPTVRTAWLTEQMTEQEILRTVRGGHHAIHPWVGAVDEASVRLAHAHGLAVNVWTCDDPARMRELMAWGIDGICTNVPDVALAARSAVLGR